MRDVLLPASDRIALIQVLVVLAAVMLATVVVRRERSLVLLVGGIGTVTLGAMALRTLH